MTAAASPSSNPGLSAQPPSDQGPTLAAIDMGTNSFHMVVARGTADGGFEVITTEKDMVRLGKGSGDMKHLTEAAMERAVASLKRMLTVAASYDAHVSAVATSAVREATNSGEFLNRVKAETGLSVDVISGFEEARLIHLGVLQALPVFDQRLLLVDIGGGSTELLIGEGSTPRAVRSVKLGSIRLTERFFRPTAHDGVGVGSGRPIDDEATRPNKKMVKKCRRYVRSSLAAAAHDLKALGFEVAVGSSGTIMALATLIASARGEDGLQASGLSFTRNELAAVIDRLVASSLNERLNMHGMDDRRADIIVGGALLLEGVFEVLGIETMTASAYALREGVLYDRLTTHRPGDRRLADLRRSNAQRLSRQLDPDHRHAETCARLAVRLFDETEELHGLGPADRERLDMAALVHNVGLSISHASHHLHTYYIVRNSEHLTGFTDRELELLAQVARYHRKSHPSDRHVEHGRLEADDKSRVAVLAGLLRVAIGLDRGHTGAVGDVILTVADEPPSPDYEEWHPNRPWLVIRPVPVDTDLDIGLEAYSAQERSRLLAEALDINVAVEGVVHDALD
ncbi:MAG: Ppx/GppA family phosphatase [Acidimicrobiia bacterium]|nr:Ppx/GppA family phosphatase [Acidimicrobiia bacterium]